MNKPLIVYKASAGSGKTFTLATEYITLLIQNPQSYSKILAVTFTNKATEEMKMRILSQLYGIWKDLPDSQDYKKKIKTALDNASDQFISGQAGKALSLLLHNFNYFRVETIDSFFQGVLRNLARELDLTPNLRIGLNDTQVEEQAVDLLIENLDKDSEMLQWLFSYIMENISDDKTWNVIGQIKKFGKTIFRDYYKDQSDALNNKLSKKGFLQQYITKIKNIRDKAKETMLMYSESFFEALQSEGLIPENLKGGKRGISSYFNKLKSDDFSDKNCMNITLASHLEQSSNWVSKSNKKANEIIGIVESSLFQILESAEEARPGQWRMYKSANATLQHISQLRLLNSIENKVREMNDEAGRFLLSDTQQLLHELIDDDDSPFIFEKIGTQLEHIMIDEFQDTSTVQWKNFKILLRECMSHNTKNLIVGDVKQSIYRWRSGDWRLLNNIEEQFDSQQLEIMNLATNYRSERNIIEFNNCFFTTATQQECATLLENNNNKESEQLKRAYADVVQKIPENKGNKGLVRIKLLPTEDYELSMLDNTLETVKELLGNQVKPSDIAIILRKNEHIVKVANYLSEKLLGTKIVSEEAFRLDASITVLILVKALRLLSHPDDYLTKSFLVKAYQKQIVGKQIQDYDLFADKKLIDAFLPQSYINDFDKLRNMSLYDLIERLYNLFSLNKITGQSAYICAFFDQISSYLAENSTDIDGFLEEWDDNICSKTIQSEELDGIRLITIHKSKGLEFKNVIIPFCDWALTNRDVIWCQPTDEPFSELPIVPIDCNGKNMIGTIYEKDYINETLQNKVDNLNLLYVAFTRAERNLFVLGHKDAAASSRSQLIQNTLSVLDKFLPNCVISGLDNKDESFLFEYGALSVSDSKTDKRTDNVFMQPVITETVDIQSFTNRVEFRQSNKSREFIGEEEDEKYTQDAYIQMGNVLHSLFSTIRNVDDIQPVLKKFQYDGLLYDDTVTKDKLLEMIDVRLNDERVRYWFSPQWTVFNECSIIHLVNATDTVVEKRPDRVITNGKEMIVIDFKFGKPKAEHSDQVNEYMSLLKSMGYDHIKGYIWYVYSNQIKEVNL